MEQTREFVLFGLGHVATLAAIGVACVVLGVLVRARPNDWIARAIAAALIIQEALKLYYFIGVADLPWQVSLPLHLCRMNELLCAVMLVTRSYRVFEVSYFLAMAGSISAMLTPALAFGFPSPDFVLFFLGHGLAVLAVVYAIFAYGFAPRLRSMFVALGVTAVYAMLITPLNYVLDANYLYLRAPPEPATMLSVFGPWPQYVFALFGLAIVACGLAYAPFGVARWRRRRGMSPRRTRATLGPAPEKQRN